MGVIVPLNKATVSESQYAIYKQSQKNISAEMHCSNIAKVIAVYPNGAEASIDGINRHNFTLDAQPIVKAALQRASGDLKYVSLPIICDIPYLITTSPPSVGSYCLLIHLDRGLGSKNVLEESVEIYGNGEFHQLEDCVAIVGFFKE